MKSATRTTLGRIAICVPLLAASIALVGCGAVTTLITGATGTPTATPIPDATSSTAVTQTSPGVYRYEDLAGGYALTFPCEPEIRELDTPGSDQETNVASCLDPATHILYLSRGEITDGPVDLRSGILNILAEIADGQIAATSYELGGLPAVWGETTSANEEVFTVVAASGESNQVYVLSATGVTADEPEVFFDSFEYLA